MGDWKKPPPPDFMPKEPPEGESDIRLPRRLYLAIQERVNRSRFTSVPEFVTTVFEYLIEGKDLPTALEASPEDLIALRELLVARGYID